MAAVVYEIRNEDSFREALAYEGITVFLFIADHVKNVNTIVNQYTQISKEFPMCVFTVVNVENLVELAKKCRVKKVPTLIVVSEGKNIGHIEGAAEWGPSLRRLLARETEPAYDED